MTIRLDVDPNNTRALLGQILAQTNNDERVMFLCESGTGKNIIQCVRVMLSRVRKRLKQDGRRRKYFMLHNTIHAHTAAGKRLDCVVVWRSKNQTHQFIESLEDLVGHGESL